jgi:hypothetical protein
LETRDGKADMPVKTTDTSGEKDSPRSHGRPHKTTSYPSEGALQGKAPFISEGVRVEIEQYGEATDPFTGKTLTKADLK